jgi:hypothetical protein
MMSRSGFVTRVTSISIWLDEWNGNANKKDRNRTLQRDNFEASRGAPGRVESRRRAIGSGAFADASKSSSKFTELEEVINRDMSKTGLMLFLEFDHGAVGRKETGSTNRRSSGL